MKKVVISNKKDLDNFKYDLSNRIIQGNYEIVLLPEAIKTLSLEDCYFICSNSSTHHVFIKSENTPIEILSKILEDGGNVFEYLSILKHPNSNKSLTNKIAINTFKKIEKLPRETVRILEYMVEKNLASEKNLIQIARLEDNIEADYNDYSDYAYRTKKVKVNLDDGKNFELEFDEENHLWSEDNIDNVSTKNLKIKVAKNKNTTPNVFEKLIKSNYSEVKEAVLFSENIDERTLRVLSYEDNLRFKYFASKKLNNPISKQNIITYITTKKKSSIAIGTMNYSTDDLEIAFKYNFTEQEFDSLFTEKKLYPSTVEYILNNGSPTKKFLKKHSDKSKRANQLLLAKYPMDFLSGDWKTILRKFLKFSSIGLGIYYFIAGLIATSNGTIVDGFLMWFGGFVVCAIINGIAGFIPEKTRK